MSAKQLIPCFFETCDQQFGFLKSDHEFSSLAGLVSYERGRHVITPYNDRQSARYPFNATARFESNDVFVELCYGNYNFTLECYVTYQRRYRFLLRDLVALLPKLDSAPIKARPEDQPPVAPQSHHIQSLLDITGQALRAHCDVLLNPPQEFIMLALDQQAVMQAKAITAQYRHNKQRACEKAANAFTKQDYRTTIMLYRPYKDDLEAPDHRIFSLAITQLDQ